MKKNVNYLARIAFCIFTTMYSFQTKPQTYQWNNVSIGGGGFVSGIITSKNEQNLMYARTDVGGAYKWNSSTSSWTPLLDWVTPGQVGYMGVSSLAIDPSATNRMYMLVGTSYFNGGSTAILRSADYGQTFSITDVSSMFKTNGNRMGRQNGEKLQVDPNNTNILYCGTESNGLWKSYDKGATWQNIATGTLNITTNNGNGLSFVVIDPNSKGGSTSSQIIYVGVSRSGTTNLYVSKNGGSSFAAVSGEPTTYMPQRAVLASDGKLFVTYGNGAGPNGTTNEPMTSGAVWKYAPSANTWTNITPSNFNHAFGGLSIDPNNANRILISTTNTYLAQYVYSGTTIYGDRVLYSTNGGTSWTDIFGNGTTSVIANGVTWAGGISMHWVGSAEFDPFNTSKVWVISGDGVFSCDNIAAGNTTWKFNVHGIEETVPRDIASIPGGPMLSVIYDYSGFRHTDITQYAPRLTPGDGSNTGIAFAGAEKQTVLRAGSDYLYYSTDQAVTWTQCAVTKGPQGKVAVSANGYAWLHCPSGSTTTYRSTNQGGSWTNVTSATSGYTYNNKDAVPVADMVDPQKFYSYDSQAGIFWKSTDRGNTFAATTFPTGGSEIIRTVPGYDGDVWIAMNGGGLKYTTDAGVTFTTITNVSNCSAVGIGKAANGANYPTIFVFATYSGVTGIFRSTNQGGNWTRVNDDAHQYGGLGNGQFVMGSMNTYGLYYMSTVGRGIAYGEPTGTSGTNAITKPLVSDGEVTEKIDGFSMKVFPNPIVTNSFDVTIVSDKMQTVSLKVIGMDGKTIDTKQAVLQTGTNKVMMSSLSQKPSGVYILSAHTADSEKPMDNIKLMKL